MREQGLSSSETAERVREHLPEGEGFSASNISHYRSGRSVPRSLRLEALSQALGVQPAELVPAADTDIETRAQPSQERRSAPASRAQKPQSGRRKGSVERNRRDTAQGNGTLILHIEDLGTKVRIQLDQRIPWELAMKLIQALKISGVTR
jgi:transcriptional regulator with XRE-family HTH domain